LSFEGKLSCAGQETAVAVSEVEHYVDVQGKGTIDYG
jgi:hypothetical protein